MLLWKALVWSQTVIFYHRKKIISLNFFKKIDQNWDARDH